MAVYRGLAGSKNEKIVLNGYSVPVWGNKKVLEMYGGGRCTAV